MIDAPAVPARRAARRPALALAKAALALLVLHHGWLLLERLRDASIAEPAVALRWALAALVLGLAALFRRRGLTMLSGRSGLVFWLLVLLLHVGVAPMPEAGFRSENLLALPLGLAATLAVALLASRPTGRVRPAPRHPRRPSRPHDVPSPRRAAPTLALHFAPRPPPAR